MSRILGGTGIIETTSRNNGNGAPTPGETTGRQRPAAPGPLGYGSVIGGLGFDGARTGPAFMGDALNGQLGGDAALWSLLYTRSYSTYRIMRGHPTLALARAITFAPIIASQWTAEKTRDDVPDAHVNLILDTFKSKRRRIFAEALRGVDFGNYKFENVWEYKRGFWLIDYLKPLAVDRNAILVDKKSGKFAGVRPYGARPTGEDDLGPLKSWVYAHDGEAGDLSGRSRFENVRETAWADWLDTAFRLGKLRNKLAGVIPIIYHPPGSFEEPENSGNYITYQQAARTAAEALMRGDYVTVERLGFNAQDLKNNPDLLKTGLVLIDFYEGGDYAPAQDGMIKNLEYDDRQLMRGYLKPERVALEARGGTRADAETHSDTGVLIDELLADDIDGQLNAGPVDDVLAVNFGEDARGGVILKTSPLVNRKAIVNERIIQSLIKAGLGEDFARTLDIDEMLETMDVPTLTKFIIQAGAKKPGTAPPPEDTPSDPNSPDAGSAAA